MFEARGPKDVKICTALDKPSRRKVDLEIDYKGITIPDKFVVGYGFGLCGKIQKSPGCVRAGFVCLYGQRRYGLKNIQRFLVFLIPLC